MGRSFRMAALANLTDFLERGVGDVIGVVVRAAIREISVFFHFQIFDKR